MILIPLVLTDIATPLKGKQNLDIFATSLLPGAGDMKPFKSSFAITLVVLGMSALIFCELGKGYGFLLTTLFKLHKSDTRRSCGFAGDDDGFTTMRNGLTQLHISFGKTFLTTF